MKKIFTRLFALLLLSLVTTSAWAQSTITAGKVYNIVNVGNSGQSMAALGVEKSAIAATDVSDYNQLWYVGSGTADGSYTLRNLGNGRYLQGAGISACWEFVTEPANLYYVAAGSYYTFSSSNDSGGYNNMHYSASQGMVVGWTTGAGATQWTFNEVEIDAAALETNWAELDALNNAPENESIYQPYLDNIFSDKSCSQLNSTYSSMSDSQLQDDENYSKLPEALQKMVKKVRDSDWAEANCIDTKPSWSSEHAKRFRLQLYEPYSYGRSTSNMLGIYYHSDMNNPTGLVANCRDLLYVMVEGEIKEGAKLYLQPLVGTGVIGGVDGVELHEGLNIVPCWADGSQYFIQYVIDTYNAETREITEYKLSNYSPIKIHIEGGDINGCFDTVGDDLNPADTDADWDAFEARAHQYNFTVIGKYMMWHMPLSLDGDYKDLAECLGTNETSVKAAMDVWEAIESAQRLASGFMSAKEIETIPYAAKVFEYNGNDDYYPSDYSEQYNNRSLAYTTADGYFMFASPGGYSHYASSTLYDVVKNIPTGGDSWGPAHEIGHTHQGPINLPSTSETSNNALANISNYFISRTSSRLGTMSDVLSQFNNETSFLGVDMNSNNVWDKLMMYTKLWFYYHVAGNNKKFYPRLFEMLRQDPISRVQGTPLTGEQTMLKFYKKACMAAEEDLTDFFDAFGFFVPVDGTLSDDYGDFKTVMTQEEIDAAKQEIAQMAKEKGWVKNITILFIDDRVGTVIGADGTTVLARRGDGSNETGVLGSINDYDSDPANDIYPTATGTYGYSVSGNSITMTGATGGVGFAIYDADGNLISFSNAYSFTLSEEAQAAIASGTAKVVAVNADNTITEVADNNPSQTQAALLAELIPLVEDMLSYEDATETKVGWYKSNALTSLKTAYDNAKDVYDKGELASYSGVYSVLYDEYNKVISSPTSKVWFVEGRTYCIKNVGGGTYMTLNESNVIASETVPTASTPVALWQVSEGFYDTFYRIKNQSTGTYIQNPTAETNSVQYTVASNAHDFIFEEVSTGKFTIKDRGKKKYLNYHSDGTVSTWGAAGENSQWEFVYLAADNTMALRSQLEDLTLLAQELVDETGEANVEYTEIPLQVTDPSAQYYIWCNNPDTSEGDIKYLVDGNTDGSTGFFHSNWHNTASAAGYHYLEVDLGASNANTVFKFAYSTRNTGSNHPDDFTVKASNTKDNYSNTESFYTVTSGLPNAKDSEWESPVFCSGGTPYRYLHFKIGGNNIFWHLDEFDLFVPKVSVKMLEKYSGIDDEYAIALQICLIESSAIINDATATENELRTAISNLQNAYDALLSEKETVESAAIEAEKEKLEELIAAAKELYNSCAESITEVPATETAITLQTTNENADYYLFCNAPYLADSKSNDYCPASQGYNLLDGNPGTYLHTAWNGSGSVSSDGQAHYLLIDLGEDNLSTYFKFSYLTRNNDGASEKPKIINVEGSNDKNTYEPIISLSGLPNASNYTYASSVLGNGVAYRYLRLVVADTYRALWDSNGFKSFSMSEFDLWTATIQDFVATLNTETCGSATEKEVLNVYRAVLSAEKAISIATTPEQLNAAYELLSKEYGILYTAKNSLDKTALEELIATATALYNKMSDGNGNMNADYATSALTADQLTAAKEEIDAAQSVVDYAGSTQLQVNKAKSDLDEKYQVLLNVEKTNEKSTLATDGLTTLIGNVNTLLGTIADATASKTEITLQVSDADSEFYLWSNAPAGDCDGIGALLDNNTGTFFGTQWGSVVDAYTHYIEIDMGDAIAVDELLFGYTTRNSTHANQRPTAIKIFGSNNKVDYTEIETISDGLATEAAERWSMDTPLSLAARYRYIRFAVATQPTTGFFNMSEFDLYANIDYSLKDYYTTATGLGFVELCLALQSAEDLLTRDYITTAQYNAVYEKLNTCYTTANNVVADDYTTRTSLETLIDDTETLISEVATVTEVETPVLSTANVYCNADNSTNSGANASDKLGVAALFDGDTSTHLHTTYGGNAQDDNLDHYVRVDMGEGKAVSVFEFSYTGRENNTNNAPTAITVQAANDVNGTWTDIVTLTNMSITEGQTATYNSGIIEADGAYRYVRFMVTDTYNHDTTTPSGGTAHKFFVMSEFGFTAHSAIEVNESYTNVTKELVRAAYDEKNTATAENGHYMTESDYNEVLAALQADYDALDAAATADKSELEALIEATTILKGQLYETVITSYTANEVTLSITEGEAGYIYCNAPEKNSTWATDNAGVAALIDLTDGDPNLETFLHTEYGNDQSADGLDHYLRVDLGADGATDYIEFGYYGRSGHEAKSPKKVIVAATNDLTDGGEWTTIATLNPTQASATAETKTGCLGNGVAYRYWRFLVEETHGGGKDGNNHQFFCMTQFNVYKCTEIVKDEQLKYTPNIYMYTTSELVTEVENAISAATTVKDDTEALQPAVDAAVEALQAVYDKLAEAINYYWCPVELTVDVANPALYIIDAIGRGEGKAWQYNAQNNNITIVNKDASNLYHLWYFMLGGGEQTVKIIPVMTPEYGLSATDFTNGINKVSAVAENCVNWSFAYVNNNYNFKPHGRNIYLSNYNGGSNPLGFYGSADGGSYVNFTAVEVEDYALTRLAKLAEGKSVVTAGTTVGSYDEATCGVYNEALEAANEMVAAASSMPQDYVNTFTRLFNANNGLRINLPDPAKFYALRCNHESRYIYVNADNKLQWAASSYDKAQSRAVWQFEEIDASNGTCKMKSLHTQSYLSGTSDSQWAFGEEGKVVTLVKSPSVEGALVFKVDGYENNGLHAHGENNTVISHTNDAGANHYFFEEVEVVTDIKHNVTMSAKFSSVTLGYNATVPAGVEAYNAVGLDEGYVSLVKVEGEVIPANTPVILYRTDGDSEAKTFTFTYTDKTAEKPASTLLGGSLYTKYVKCDDSDYYKLMMKNGKAKMYLMYKEFDAEGNSQGATHAGGHIKCSANKIYMRVPAALGIASYGMRFVDYGTTDIDDVKGESGDAKIIYDLQGRKLTEITEPGFYIVDGKKVYVK